MKTKEIIIAILLVVSICSNIFQYNNYETIKNEVSTTNESLTLCDQEMQKPRKETRQCLSTN